MLGFLRWMFSKPVPPLEEEQEVMEFEVYEFLTKVYTELQKKENPDEVDMAMKRSVMGSFSRVRVVFYRIDSPALSRFLIENRGKGSQEIEKSTV